MIRKCVFAFRTHPRTNSPRFSASEYKKTLLILLSLGIILRVYFAYAIPPFTGNDEPAHLRYAQHILAEKKLPNATLYRDESLAGNEYFQPPLYYLLGSLLIRGANEPINQLQILRTASIILWIIAFYFTYKIVLLIKLPAIYATSTLAFSALLPTYVANSSTVTNDALAIPIVIVALYFVLSSPAKKFTILKLIFFAGLSALTILTKLSGLIIMPAVLLLIFYEQKKLNYQLMLKLTVFGLFTLLFTSWWFFYNLLTYNHLLGPLEASTAPFTQVPFSIYKIYLLIRGAFATFWASYGPANEIRLPANVYLMLFLLTIYASLGIVLYLKKIIAKKAKMITNNKSALILSIALITNIALFLIFNINQHQPLGRYLYPSLIQISLVFSTGLYFLTPKAVRGYVPGFLILGLLTLNIWGAITLSNFYNGLAENFAIYGENKCQTATYFSSTREKYGFSAIRCKLER